MSLQLRYGGSQSHRGSSEGSICFYDAVDRDMEEDLSSPASGYRDAYLKSIIYGGIDGLITTFTTITSAAGADVSFTVVLILGIAHLFADGLSMGMGDILSTQAEMEYNNVQRRRERWELDNQMDRKIQDMVDLYVEKGVSRDDSQLVVETLAKYDHVFLELVMVEEHGLLPQEESDSEIKAGLITMAAFVFFGSIPLIPYIIALIPGFEISRAQIWVSVSITLAVLFILGAMKGRLVDVGQSWYHSGVVMTATGGFSAAVGFIFGLALRNISHW